MRHIFLTALDTSPLIFKEVHPFTQEKITPLKSGLIIPNKKCVIILEIIRNYITCGRHLLLLFVCCLFQMPIFTPLELLPAIPCSCCMAVSPCAQGSIHYHLSTAGFDRLIFVKYFFIHLHEAC